MATRTHERPASTQAEPLSKQDRALLAALPMHVDLDQAQVSVEAHVLPKTAKSSLDKLVRANKVEQIADLEGQEGPRFRRTAMA